MAEGGIGRADSGTESLPVHNSQPSRLSQNQVERASVEVFIVMSRLGYGREMRWRRAEAYMERDRLLNTQWGKNAVTVITVGSKGEGLTCSLESDMDTIYVMNKFVCVEAGIDLHTIADDISVFRMDTRVYPGHCRLLLERQGSGGYSTVRNALCDDGYGNALLCSGLFIDEHSSTPVIPGEVRHERAGPSVPSSVGGTLHMDSVYALRCLCPSIMQRWAARLRRWPSPDIVQKVVSMGAFVTPVGFKGSEYKHVEWRICFNTGETELVKNLNDTQTKLYVMLKMIVKDILKPSNKEITSYVLKNIILWQAENNPQTVFHERSLFYWLHEGLGELRTAISTRQLPYYMIPERNLMAACGLRDEQQRKWVATITDMMAEGPRVILRMHRIRQAVISNPQPLLWYNSLRMELEMLELEFHNRGLHCLYKNGVFDFSDYILQEISRRECEIVMEVAQRMYMEGSGYNDLNGIKEMMLM